MAKDVFETMFGEGVLNGDFFKTLDDLTKNIQSTIHTFQEKYENGKLVSRDEEKYENGEKTVDIHETAANTLNSNNEDAKLDCGCAHKCNCCGDSCGTCNAVEEECTVDEKDELIAGLEVDVQNLKEELSKWRSSYYKALAEKEELEDKLSKIKGLF